MPVITPESAVLGPSIDEFLLVGVTDSVTAAVPPPVELKDLLSDHARLGNLM